jgi:hypothetical protein
MSDKAINYLGSSKAHSQFVLPFTVNWSKITQCYPSWCNDIFSLKILNATAKVKSPWWQFIYISLEYMAFRSTVPRLWNLFGSAVNNSRICVFILSRYPFYFLFISTWKEECVICHVFLYRVARRSLDTRSKAVKVECQVESSPTCTVNTEKYFE